MEIAIYLCSLDAETVAMTTELSTCCLLSETTYTVIHILINYDYSLLKYR